MRLLVLSLALVLAACEEGPGPPRMYSRARSGEQIESLVARLYPAGTPETRLVNALRADGFIVDPDRNAATREWTRSFCVNRLEISWQADAQGRLLDVKSKQDQACP